MTTPRTTARRWLRRGAKLLALVIAVELILRLAFGFGDPPLLQADPDIGYLFQANQDCRRFGNRVAVNRFHQRTAEIGERPDAGTHRVLCLGDSVTWGGALTDQSETYPELLAATLRATRGDRRWEVLNASAGSWGFGNEAAYLRRFGTFGSGTLVLQIGSHDLLQPASTGESVGKTQFMPDRKPSCAIVEVFGRYLLPRLERAIRGAPPPAVAADGDAQFRENMACFREIADRCAADGVRLVVLHIPDRDEVARDAEPPARYEPYRARFLRLCDEQGVPVVNLVARWREGPVDAAGYFRDAVHPNANGNRAIADALAPTVP